MNSQINFRSQTLFSFSRSLIKSAIRKYCEQYKNIAQKRNGLRSVNDSALVKAELLESRVLLSGLDFGDAPDSYGTTITNDGPRHDDAMPMWVQLGLDLNSESLADNSGSSVSLSADGQIVAIGAPRNDGNGSNSGHVRIYQYDGSEWLQLGSDIDGEAAGDLFGTSVSLSSNGMTVAIGAHHNNGNGDRSGHVQIYQFDGTEWLQLGADIDGEAAGDWSGISVALSSNGMRVAIGAHRNTGNGDSSGHVRIYQFDGSNWQQLGADIDGQAAGNGSGYSVAISDDGSTVAIGAINNNGLATNADHVRIFQFNGTTWQQMGMDIDGEASHDKAGQAISLSADGLTVAIGAFLNAGNGDRSGHVRIYQFDGAMWNQLGTDIDGEAAGDSSGYSVSLSADGLTVAIGAPGNDGNGNTSGHVRIFKYNGVIWQQLAVDIDGEAANDSSGRSVSISSDGMTVAIGAPYNSQSGYDSGHVRIYRLSELILGTTRDIELDGNPTTAADGDDTIGISDDEDGINFTSDLIAGHSANFDVTTNRPGTLAWWVDFDSSGTFDSNERFEATITSFGTHSISFDVPSNVIAGQTYSRFRFATNAAEIALPTGLASDGEVEDYLMTLIRQDDFGDAPDSYGTTLANDGPNHGNPMVDWTQMGLDIDGEAAADLSGSSVSISANGQIVAIGARYNDGNGSASGHVRIYQFVDARWQQLGSDIDGEAAYDYFGNSVSLSDDGHTVAIGAIQNSGNGDLSGHVRIYQFDGAMWNQLGTDIDGEAASDSSGYSVSLSADGLTVAIGAYGNYGNSWTSGHVRIFQYVDESWQQLGADIDGEASNDWSGFAVSLSADGKTVAIGAFLNDGNGNNSGHVRIYQYEGSKWQQLGTDIDGEAANDQSGYSVSLSADGRTIAIGAPENDGVDPLYSSESGHVRIYQYVDSGWQQLGSDLDAEAVFNRAGRSVSISSDGMTVAIGAPENDGNGSGSGQVRIYRISELRLGLSKDFEAEGQPTTAADGDDTNGSNDENGIVFTSALVAGHPASIEVTTSDAGTLAWWIDFDSNGTFDLSERFEAIIASHGTHSLSFDVPASAIAKQTYARFRLASNSADVENPTGIAADGEVEDYTVILYPQYNVVTNLFDTGPGSLRNAVEIANSAPVLSTITFDAAIASGNILITEPFVIESTVQIQGPSAVSITIDGQHLTHILEIHLSDPDDVELSNLALLNGTTSNLQQGELIRSENADLTLTEINFTGNSSVAIEAHNGELTLNQVDLGNHFLVRSHIIGAYFPEFLLASAQVFKNQTDTGPNEYRNTSDNSKLPVDEGETFPFSIPLMKFKVEKRLEIEATLLTGQAPVRVDTQSSSKPTHWLPVEFEDIADSQIQPSSDMPYEQFHELNCDFMLFQL